MLCIKEIMKEFGVFLTAYKEESEGQIKELQAFAANFGVPFLRRSELPDTVKMESGADYAHMQSGIIYIDKEQNDDLIKALRLALTFNADGVVIPFGNNENRDYIKTDLAYYSKEVKKALEEVIRLAPLFGRKIKRA